MVCADIGMEIARATRMVAAGLEFSFCEIEWFYTP
jgi:hypothetical protein